MRESSPKIFNATLNSKDKTYQKCSVVLRTQCNWRAVTGAVMQQQALHMKCHHTDWPLTLTVNIKLVFGPSPRCWMNRNWSLSWSHNHLDHCGKRAGYPYRREERKARIFSRSSAIICATEYLVDPCPAWAQFHQVYLVITRDDTRTVLRGLAAWAVSSAWISASEIKSGNGFASVPSSGAPSTSSE